MEKWAPLLGYPGYSASTLGRIRNDRRESILAVVTMSSGHKYVGLVKDGVQVKRALSKLIAGAFVQNPRPDKFTTPIHLNGDLTDCEARNLLWRPRWFAMNFTQQFKRDLPEYPPLREKRTRQEFANCWQPVMMFGLLYMDLVISIANQTYVFPTMQTFEWVI